MPKIGMENTMNLMEVEVVRTKITLACTECKQRNYNMTKDKKAHPDRMETKKYCRFCRTHTLKKKKKKEKAVFVVSVIIGRAKVNRLKGILSSIPKCAWRQREL